MRIPEEIIERVKNENDIVDVISQRVALKKSGRNYMGLCPFHGEKTPSFSVNRERGIYKCFGCGEGGNVISFVMATEKMNFVEAVRHLAERAGIDIPREDPKDRELYDKKENLENMNKDAARFFYENLKSNPKAWDYFKKREILPETAVKFGLGFSPDSWDSLKKYLLSKGYKEKDFKDSGLFGVSDKGRIYDRFRNRLMFPVFDHRGRVTGFGARVFDDSKPKYLNSPETLLFKKGTNLYGLNLFLKNREKKEDYIVICEGYMDCIAMHQAGINTAVASLGTAITPMQARLIKRYVNKVIVSFDADEAGVMAAERGMDVLTAEGLEVKILTFPDGKDPDEYIRTHGRDKFLSLLDKALPLNDHRIKSAREGLDIRKDDDKVKYFEKVKPILESMDDVEKDVYITSLSDETGISKDAIYSEIRNTKMTADNKGKNPGNNPGNNNGNEVVMKAPQNQNISSLRNFFIEPGQLRAQRYLLKLYSEGETDVADLIKEEDFGMDIHKKIFRLIESFIYGDRTVSTAMGSALTEREEISEWALIEAMDDIPEDVPRAKLIRDYSDSLKEYIRKNKRNSIIKEIQKLENEGRTAESLELVKELLSLEKE